MSAPVKKFRAARTARGRMQQLRDFLATLPDKRFNISALYTNASGSMFWPARKNILFEDCKTAACIAGWSNALFGAANKYEDSTYAANALELSEGDAEELFVPTGYEEYPNRFTRKMAIKTIDHYLATGRMSWAEANKRAKATGGA